MIGLILLPIFLGIAMVSKVPPIYSPEAMAEWSNCEPSKIAYGVAQSIDYQKQGDTWDSSYMCLMRKTGDCKCMSVTARDTLQACGLYAKSVTVRRGTGKGLARHTMAVFALPDGRRGYIDAPNWKVMEAGTDWAEVVASTKWELE